MCVWQLAIALWTLDQFCVWHKIIRLLTELKSLRYHFLWSWTGAFLVKRLYDHSIPKIVEWNPEIERFGLRSLNDIQSKNKSGEKTERRRGEEKETTDMNNEHRFKSWQAFCVYSRVICESVYMSRRQQRKCKMCRHRHREHKKRKMVHLRHSRKKSKPKRTESFKVRTQCITRFSENALRLSVFAKILTLCFVLNCELSIQARLVYRVCPNQPLQPLWTCTHCQIESNW